jgi:hypothetical protein
MPPSVLTIGHSNHPLERFLALLARHGVEALVLPAALSPTFRTSAASGAGPEALPGSAEEKSV